MAGATDRIHATAIAIGHRAVLIRGTSGSGKSDLALRCLSLSPSALIDAPARLIADDQVLLKRQDTTITAFAPAETAGKLEVRGIGIISIVPISEARVVLVADIVRPQDVERYPDPRPTAEILGLHLPLLRIAAFEASAPLKLLIALTNPELRRRGAMDDPPLLP